MHSSPEDNNRDIHNFSLHNPSLRIRWLPTTGKPSCSANYIIYSFRLSQSLERILSGKFCRAILGLHLMVWGCLDSVIGTFIGFYIDVCFLFLSHQRGRVLLCLVRVFTGFDITKHFLHNRYLPR